MWSLAILLFFAGTVLTDSQNGWDNGKEYVYNVKSRTLAAADKYSKHFTGILIEGHLTVQPNGQDTLRAKILKPRYSQIHTSLRDGWDSEIPQDHLNLQNLPLSENPFEIKTKNGVVKDLVVDKNVPTWEVNILKSIVSQLQVDTLGENAKNLKHNQLPEGKHPYAVYKTMEDSVTGKCEVLYDVSPLPEQAIHTKRESVPMPELRGDGEIISIVKTKNYTNCDQRVSYHHGIDEINEREPGTNANGQYLSRSSISRIVISGNPKKYTIQSSVTTNKILNDDNHDNGQGMVVSRVNLTLHEVKDSLNPLPALSNPQSTGNLVYNYNNPFGSPSARRPNRLNEGQRHKHHDHSHSDESTSAHNAGSDTSDSSSSNEGDNYLQPKPTLTEAPQNAFLPFFIGNSGNSIQNNNKVNAVESTKNIAQEIGNEMEKPDSMPDQETFDKFIILCRLIRTMNADQISAAQRNLYSQESSSKQLNHDNSEHRVRRNAWIVFRDAVAQAGTGPALVNIKQWIQNKQILGNEAANVVEALAKSTKTPTSEYMDTFFDMVKMQETKSQPALRDSAVLSFSNLIRRAIVNKQSAHNLYPVHTFGKFSSKNHHNVHEKYIPYIAEQLKAAIDEGDSTKIQVYTTAIGNTGDPRMLSVFEPYLEGKKQISSFQRLVMVLSLDKLTETRPKIAQTVLYKIYSNTADHHEIRTAAVYLLMQTNPSANMLQRMAEATNYDSNKNVNSAVKSTIKSLAQMYATDNPDLYEAARSASHLLTSENYGPEYSKAFYKYFVNPFTQSGQMTQANQIGSNDISIPKGIYVSNRLILKGLKLPSLEFGGGINSWQDFWNFIQKQWNNNQEINKNNQKAREQQYSPENLAKLLNIHGNDPEQVEGFLFSNGLYRSHYWAFDNRSLENIPGQMKQLFESMHNGKNLEETKFDNYEIAVGFPTDTGFPFHFSLNMPSLVNVNGRAKLSTTSDSDNKSEIPNSATLSGKIRVIYGTEIQKRYGFIAPFEHQDYVVGVDKNIQIHLPIRSEVEFNSDKEEIRIKVQPNEDEQEFKVVQFKIQPFNSKYDILSLKPILKDENTHIIGKSEAVSSNLNIPNQNKGNLLEFNWERPLDEPNMENSNNILNSWESLYIFGQAITNLYSCNAADLEYQKYDIKLSPSHDISAEMQASHKSMISTNNNNADNSQNWTPNAKVLHLEKNLNENERKQKLLNEVTKDINSAEADAIDINLQLNGGIQLRSTATAAFGMSNVDPKCRGLLYTSVQVQGNEDYHFAAAVEAKAPNTESLDYEKILKNKVSQEYDVKVDYGINDNQNKEDQHDQIKIHGKVRQTDEHKNEIQQSPDAQTCTKQTRQTGNKMTTACRAVNQRAASINEGELVITFENDSPLKEIALNGLEYVVSFTDDDSVKKDRTDKEDDNKISFAFKMSSNNQKAQITLKTPEGKVQYNDVDLNSEENEVEKDIEDVQDGEILGIVLPEEQICFLDKTEVKTFDNHRYAVQLGKCWHAVMTTYPKNDPDRINQQLEVPEDQHVSILARENENGQKELKITLGENVIDLIASADSQVQAKVNGQQVQYSMQQSYRVQEDGQAVFELFELPDKSVKLVSDKYEVNVIYDGQRAQIEVEEYYRNSVVGLCGNGDGESENDQQTPQGCLLQKPEEFAATYALVNDNQCEGPARQNAEKAKKSKCHFQNARPGNVISELEAGRKNEQRNKENSEDDKGKHCTMHRTKVIRSDTEICFSLRPVPTCSSTCSANEMKAKTVQFHCVARSTTAEKVAQRIENGANPDLSQKPVSKTETYQVPTLCT